MRVRTLGSTVYAPRIGSLLVKHKTLDKNKRTQDKHTTTHDVETWPSFVVVPNKKLSVDPLHARSLSDEASMLIDAVS